MIYRLSEVPPSLNMMFHYVRKGRVLTKEYREWRKAMSKELLPVTPLKCEKYSLEIQVPRKTRGDIDNRIKAISDLLVEVGATPDDRHMDECRIVRADIDETIIEVVGLA